MSLAVKKLGAADAALWREIRLEALGTAPGAFSEKLADWEHRPLADSLHGFRRQQSMPPFSTEGSQALRC
jgi:hypothetical protein